MEIFRTYKFQLYPTEAQAERLSSWLGAVRAVYNAALEQRMMYERVQYTRTLDGARVGRGEGQLV